MVDAVAQLDLIEATIGNGPARIPVAIDVDAGWWLAKGRLARIGPKRSPLHWPAQARRLAQEIVGRPGTELAGLMAYEGQIAGVGDRVPGRPFRSASIRWMQSRSERDLGRRLPEIVAAVREVAPLGFVNGGGTGSLARTAAAGTVTELTAGSGFYAPALFDTYRSLDLEPAALFCVSVVRRPGPGVATALGGGYVASGGGGRDRLPQPYLPSGLVLDAEEGAGEVQTPLIGGVARRIGIGNRIYMRHAKAGELCEHFNSLYLVAGDEIVDEVATYRGDGQAFL
jgi:D-serine deaminase-like pyridoxal phosphate-dependent protein